VEPHLPGVRSRLVCEETNDYARSSSFPPTARGGTRLSINLPISRHSARSRSHTMTLLLLFGERVAFQRIVPYVWGSNGGRFAEVIMPCAIPFCGTGCKNKSTSQPCSTGCRALHIFVEPDNAPFTLLSSSVRNHSSAPSFSSVECSSATALYCSIREILTLASKQRGFRRRD
jgi:hypothetical protein